MICSEMKIKGDRWTNNVNGVAVKVVDSFHTMDISRALT
jgi:hypothetical protein